MMEHFTDVYSWGVDCRDLTNEEEQLGWSRSVSQSKKDLVNASKSFNSRCDSGYSVPGMEHDTGREIEPISAETLQCLRAPVITEVMLFEQLDQVKGKNADGKVQAVC